jgi:hypothetical protein
MYTMSDYFLWHLLFAAAMVGLLLAGTAVSRFAVWLRNRGSAARAQRALHVTRHQRA